MARHFVTPGLVLKSTRVGDIHRNLALLTLDLGLIHAMAHGAGGERGKLKGSVDLFTSGLFYLYHDPVHSSYKVTDVEVAARHHGLRTGVRKLYAASLWVEIAYKTFGGDASGTLDLLREGLHLLDRATEDEVSTHVVQFLWRYLALAGQRPDLDRCDVCGRPLSPHGPAYLDAQHGGLACASCARPAAPSIDPAARRYLAVTEGQGMAEAAAAAVDERSVVALQRVLLAMAERMAGSRLLVLASADGNVF